MLKLKEFRTKRGLSQADLAKILGLAPSAVSNWEQGTREPNIENLTKIAIVLDVTVDDLIEFKKVHDAIGKSLLEKIQKLKGAVKK